MKNPLIVIIATAALVWSCAPSSPATWTSMPSVQQISKPAYDVRAEPLKHGDPFFVSFKLDIVNRSSGPLEVDWNNTRYIYKGEDLGVFVFRGIDPGGIKGAIPADTIPAGRSFSKEIFPLRTIAFLPRDQLPAPGWLGFEPGILPSGENTLRLSLRQDDRLWQETLTVHLGTKSKTP